MVLAFREMKKRACDTDVEEKTDAAALVSKGHSLVSFQRKYLENFKTKDTIIVGFRAKKVCYKKAPQFVLEW